MSLFDHRESLLLPQAWATPTGIRPTFHLRRYQCVDVSSLYGSDFRDSITLPGGVGGTTSVLLAWLQNEFVPRIMPILSRFISHGLGLAETDASPFTTAAG
jgi:hypothetical protein